MAINFVKLAGVDESDNPIEVRWAFDSVTGAMLTSTAAEVTVYSQIVDGNADGYQYTGIAAPGTLTSAASWQIRRINLTGNPVVTEWADGDSVSDNVWDNRASMVYS